MNEVRLTGEQNFVIQGLLSRIHVVGRVIESNGDSDALDITESSFSDLDIAFGEIIQESAQRIAEIIDKGAVQAKKQPEPEAEG